VHVVCGALVLTTSLVLTLRSWRARFAAAARDGLKAGPYNRAQVGAGLQTGPDGARA
jgi:hypothetical protein